MSTARKHFVEFLSPGTFVSELTIKPIDAWDPVRAVEMAENVTERYGAKPYGFRFVTRIVGKFSDGEGGELDATKEVERSGIYFLGGDLLSYDEIERRDFPGESILRTNMRANGYWLVCVVTKNFKSTLPFEERDFVVDAKGAIVQRGDDPEHVAYRDLKTKEYERECLRASAESNEGSRSDG